MKRLHLLGLWLALMAAHSPIFGQNDGFYTLKKDSVQSYYQLSISDLYNLNVTTASNASEKLRTAPATIIVVNEEDIRARGYTELYDVLNDLPGFDLSRAFGDDHYYLYARGYRKTLSDQMLFMVDGVIMNHLYNNNMDAFLQYPLYGIKQIEVVYGPASAVYGANAFAGVINLITRKEGKSSVFMGKGSDNTNIVDLSLSKQAGDLTLTVLGRLYMSDGPNLSNRHPLLTDTLYTSPALWGPFLPTGFAGYNSPMEGRFLYGQLQYKELTVGVMSWFNASGLGSEFPADRVLNAGTWQFDEQTVYAKYETKIGQLTSKTLMRARQSGNPESSLFIASWDGGYNGTKYASYWSTTNKAFSFFQDFSYPIAGNLSANFGVKYYHRVLQRDYDIVDGPAISNSDSLPYPMASVPLPYRRINGQSNHSTLQDQGAYLQLKYTATRQLELVGGVRLDYNSVWGPVLSPRVGVVAEPVPNLVAKAFFGTAFLEPSSRVLYGGWQGTFSNPDLVPERMQTFEASVAYTQRQFALGGALYVNRGVNVISQVGGAPVNLGQNRAIGVELFGSYLYKPGLSALSRLKLDAFLSYVNASEDAAGMGEFETTPNIAPIKLRLLGTATFANRFDASIQARYVHAIPTVASNPIREIDPWLVADANLLARNFPVKGMNMGLKIYNLLNADYFHPGYRDASAGEVLYGADGEYVGSQGWYSSRLPQPFRTFLLTLRLDF
jgi:outer membrane receptor protein involved in Fe transport